MYCMADLYMLPCLSMAEVSVGFNSTSFEFKENNKIATLLLVVEGSLERPVNVLIITEDGTATGTVSPL